MKNLRLKRFNSIPNGWYLQNILHKSTLKMFQICMWILVELNGKLSVWTFVAAAPSIVGISRLRHSFCSAASNGTHLGKDGTISSWTQCARLCSGCIGAAHSGCSHWKPPLVARALLLHKKLYLKDLSYLKPLKIGQDRTGCVKIYLKLYLYPVL